MFEASPMGHETAHEPPPPAPPPPCVIDEEQFVQLYEKNVGVLVAVAIRKFQVPADDAEALAHEVFLSYLKRKDDIRDLHKWLLGAICNASRYYWRQHGRNIEQLDTELAVERPDPASRNILEIMFSRIAAGEALAGLSPRYQYILRLRYFEGYSINEIAEHLGVTAKYTQKLVTKCLRRAEEVFNASEPRKKK
jgi:RNA polymerase sigma factor (sigma-70 family)